MSKFICLFLVPFVALSAVASPADKNDPRETYSTDGWKLAWSEEFNGTGAPSREVWKPEVGFIRNHEPHYLLLNLALGGYGNKVVDEDWTDPKTGKVVPAAMFPMEMKIDYVRYYTKGE